MDTGVPLFGNLDGGSTITSQRPTVGPLGNSIICLVLEQTTWELCHLIRPYYVDD